MESVQTILQHLDNESSAIEVKIQQLNISFAQHVSNQIEDQIILNGLQNKTDFL